MDKICEYKDIVCDKADKCPYDGKCKLYHIGSRGNGFATSMLARGEDDMLDFIKRQMKEGCHDFKIHKDR